MSKFATGQYQLEHPEKYIGENVPIYRSSWERDFMKYCDLHPDVLEWVSEPKNLGTGRAGIPYTDPLTNKQKVYIPDFLVTFLTKDKERKTKLIEIKPRHEALQEHARNSKDSAIKARNDAKWMAATAWCMRRGIEFLVLTEAQLYDGFANKGGRKNPVTPYVKLQAKKLTPKKPKTSKTAKPNMTTGISKSSMSVNKIRQRMRTLSVKSVSSVGKVGRI